MRPATLGCGSPSEMGRLVHPEDDMGGLDERACGVAHLQAECFFAAGGDHHHQFGAALEAQHHFGVHRAGGDGLDRAAQGVARRGGRGGALDQNGPRGLDKRPGRFARGKAQTMGAVFGDDGHEVLALAEVEHDFGVDCTVVHCMNLALKMIARAGLHDGSLLIKGWRCVQCI